MQPHGTVGDSSLQRAIWNCATSRTYGPAKWKLPGGAGLVWTVSWNVLLAVANPSLTVTVMLALPDCPANGVTVMVRLPPAPPKTMPAFCTSAGFDEVPESVRLAAGVSASLMVKGIA